MRITSRRSRVGDPGTVTGTVRLGRRTNRLAARLRPGDIALIDHLDLDRVTAESLVSARVLAVLNAKPSISGRYPNLGPELLVQAGIPLLDDIGDDVFRLVRDGDRVRLDGDTIVLGGAAVAQGVRQDAESVAKAMAGAGEGMSVQLESFAADTAVYLRQERGLLLDGVGLPTLRTPMTDRPCVVVVRGYSYREDLELLKSYLSDLRPVLIGVDGGADALLEAGYRPDLVVGDLDGVSETALRCGAELVVRAEPDGRCAGLARIAQLNLPASVVPAAANGTDLALLLADAAGATPIVAVGMPATLTEFLDRGRAGAASTFLTRLRLGATLVDAATLGALYRPRSIGAAQLALAGATVTTMAAAVVAVTFGSGWLAALADRWDALMTAVQSLY